MVQGELTFTDITGKTKLTLVVQNENAFLPVALQTKGVLLFKFKSRLGEISQGRVLNLTN